MLKRQPDDPADPAKQGGGRSSGDGENTWPIRVAVHLEEAPAFHFVPRRLQPPIRVITWTQPDRSWVVRGDSEMGIGGHSTQRLWLALLSIYEAERRGGEPGVVYYSKRMLAERMRISRDGKNFKTIEEGLIQLDALRAYVTGQPLPGPDADEVRKLGPGGSAGPKIEYLYSFLGGDGLDVEEEASKGQLFLFRPDGRRPRRNWSRRRLGRYVVACLDAQHARTVPDFVFDLKGGWAVRLVRLLGKRAYQKETLQISLAALLPAIPALMGSGAPLVGAKAREGLDRAHKELYEHGFITDARIENGSVSYRFGAAHRTQAAPQLDEFAAETVDLLVAVFGDEGRRPWLADFVKEVGGPRARATISDGERLNGGPDPESLRPRLYGLIEQTRIQARADRAHRQTSEDSRAS